MTLKQKDTETNDNEIMTSPMKMKQNVNDIMTSPMKKTNDNETK